MTTLLKEQNLRMLKEVGVTVTPAFGELVGLDIDTGPFDNSDIHEEGVRHTCKGYYVHRSLPTRGPRDTSSTRSLVRPSSNLRIAHPPS